MALIVETGAGVEDADSFVSLVDAQAFIDLRDLSVTLTEALLLRSMDALAGVSGLFDKYPLGEVSKDQTIPNGVVRAQTWLAYYIEQGSDPAAISEPAIRSEKVDVIETEFAVSDGAVTSFNPLSMPNVRDSLQGIITPYGRLERG